MRAVDARFAARAVPCAGCSTAWSSSTRSPFYRPNWKGYRYRPALRPPPARAGRLPSRGGRDLRVRRRAPLASSSDDGRLAAAPARARAHPGAAQAGRDRGAADVCSLRRRCSAGSSRGATSTSSSTRGSAAGSCSPRTTPSGAVGKTTSRATAAAHSSRPAQDDGPRRRRRARGPPEQRSTGSWRSTCRRSRSSSCRRSSPGGRRSGTSRRTPGGDIARNAEDWWLAR